METTRSFVSYTFKHIVKDGKHKGLEIQETLDKGTQTFCIQVGAFCYIEADTMKQAIKQFEILTE